MELEKIRSLSDEELQAAQISAAEQLFRIRFLKSLGNQEGLKKLRTLKLEIAQSKTVARERKLATEKLLTPREQSKLSASTTSTKRRQNRTKV